jgi:tetratricopeptide (TPR) repeat protein
MTGSHRDEIAKLEALYSANPEGRIFTHLAEAYRKAGDLARARETIERGLERHGDYSSAHVVRGRILIDQGERGEAERAFQRVLALDPENRIALWTLGDLAREAGRPAEALGFYQELLLLDPTDEAAEALVRSLDYELGAATAAAAEPEAVRGAAVAEPPRFEEPLLAEEPFEFVPLAEGPTALEPIDLELGGMGADSFDPFDLGSAMLDLEVAAFEASPEPLDPEMATLDAGPELLELDALTDEPAPPLFDLDEALFGMAPVEAESSESESVEAEVVASELIELDGEVALEAELSEGDLYGFEEFSSEFNDFGAEGSELPWGGEESSAGWEDGATVPAGEGEPFVGAEFDLAEAEGGAELIAEDVFVTEDLLAGEEELTGESELIDESELTGEAEIAAVEPDFEVPASAGAHEVGPVVTETLAELYASQGLYDRATDIYRELLRIRPGDPRLLSRLEALEGTAQAAASAPEPEPVVVARSGRSIGQYLSGLLAFVGTAPEAGEPEADAREAELPAPEAAAEMLPVAEMAPVEEIAVAEVAPVEAPAAEAEPAAGELLYLDESMVVEEGSAESDVLYLDESMVVAEAAGAAGDEFDRLFAGQGEGEEETPVAPPVAAAGAGEGDDDDLEMFRSWLQNLKRS